MVPTQQLVQTGTPLRLQTSFHKPQERRREVTNTCLLSGEAGNFSPLSHATQHHIREAVHSSKCLKRLSGAMIMIHSAYSGQEEAGCCRLYILSLLAQV